jgi:hypothetical protein
MTDRETRPATTTLLGTRLLALALAVGTAALLLPEASSQAADPKRSRAKMVELNTEALLSYDVKDWVTAKDLLNHAIAEAKGAGLENNNMTARTYVHLGAVYWTGFHNREEALRYFSLAKQIRPDIQLTPRIETPELQSVFAEASDQEEASTSDDLVAGPREPAAPVVAKRPGPVRRDSSGEPDLPETMSAPLMCTVPAIVRARRALTMRCALQPDLTAKLVQIHVRPRGVEAYQDFGMQRTPKGWYIITLPKDLMQEGSLQVYFDARDALDKQIASNGQNDSPSVIVVGRPSSTSDDDDDDPMRWIREQAKAERYEAGLHRRRAGSFWIGMGGGMGWGYVPAGNLEWQQQVRVSAMTTRAGLLQLVPEVGMMLTDDFGLALQGRIEFLRQQQAYYEDPVTGQSVQLAANLSGAPTTVAPAVFARAIGYLDLSPGGNLRLSYSGDLGGGFIRFPVKPVAVVYQNADGETIVDSSRTIAKTDTRQVGTFLYGASVGFVWNLSRYFALALNGRVLGGYPAWGAVVEGTLSAQLAFGGKRAAGEFPEEDEEDRIDAEEPALGDVEGYVDDEN